MPQIAAGGNATFTVPAGGFITVQSREGWVQLEFPTGTKVYEGNPGNQVFGPYVGGSARLVSVQGPIYYETSVAAGNSGPVSTWSALPAAASNVGAIFRVSDIGANGAQFISNGARWRAVNGAATLAALGASITGISTTEQIVFQSFIPAGAWQANDIIRINKLALGKSGITNTGQLTIRIGTAGTVADTAITGLSNLAALAAGDQSGGFEFDIKLVSATSAQKVGGNAGTSFGGGSSTTVAAATTISSAAANALWVSVCLSSSGATDTVSVDSGQIQLVTP